MSGIDAHQHFWKFDPVRDAWITPDMHNIRRDFFPHHLAPLLREHDIEGTVAVQADQSETETKFLLDLAAKNDFIKGVVGWTDLCAGNLTAQLEYYRSFRKLKGFRHIVQAEAAGFMDQQVFRNGVRNLGRFGYTYDLLIYHHQMEEAVRFVQSLDDQPIVIDHLGKPDIKNHAIAEWKRHMRQFRSLDHVCCKVSGMVTEAKWNGWTLNDFRPYWDVVLDTFGPGRLMCGSDWPVCLLSASYAGQHALAESLMQALSVAEKDALRSANARRFYNL